jgi:hypothetical protein
MQGRRNAPSILDSAWLSYRPKGLLLHGEAASDDGPPARATNAASVIMSGKTGGGDEADRSLWPDLTVMRWSPCLRMLLRGEFVYHAQIKNITLDFSERTTRQIQVPR